MLLLLAGCSVRARVGRPPVAWTGRAAAPHPERPPPIAAQAAAHCTPPTHLAPVDAVAAVEPHQRLAQARGRAEQPERVRGLADPVAVAALVGDVEGELALAARVGRLDKVAACGWAGGGGGVSGAGREWVGGRPRWMGGGLCESRQRSPRPTWRVGGKGHAAASAGPPPARSHSRS